MDFDSTNCQDSPIQGEFLLLIFHVSLVSDLGCSLDGDTTAWGESKFISKTSN